MKKIVLFTVAVILFISPFVAALPINDTSRIPPQKNNASETSAFTHTVFIEQAATTGCPNCPIAAEALFSLYSSSEYPFYYITLVTDTNPLALGRSWGHYRGRVIPTIFVDGGFSQKSGRGATPQQTEQLYRPFLEGAGNRTVRPLELTTNVTGHGDATLDITVTVKNTGSKPYLGFVRSYVTEIVSRWIDNNGDPYHFGFLDYAIKKVVFLGPQKSRTFTMTWDGAAQHGNLTFPDIVDNNMMVITAVAHWLPHLIQKEENIDTHLAFYVDQTDGATVE